jgi:hypothetical protein
VRATEGREGGGSGSLGGMDALEGVFEGSEQSEHVYKLEQMDYMKRKLDVVVDDGDKQQSGLFLSAVERTALLSSGLGFEVNMAAIHQTDAFGDAVVALEFAVPHRCVQVGRVADLAE